MNKYDEPDGENMHRREFIKGVVGVSVTGSAGCMGYNDDDDSVEIPDIPENSSKDKQQKEDSSVGEDLESDGQRQMKSEGVAGYGDLYDVPGNSSVRVYNPRFKDSLPEYGEYPDSFDSKFFVVDVDHIRETEREYLSNFAGYYYAVETPERVYMADYAGFTRPDFEDNLARNSGIVAFEVPQNTSLNDLKVSWRGRLGSNRSQILQSVYWRPR